MTEDGREEAQERITTVCLVRITLLCLFSPHTELRKEYIVTL